MRTTAQVMLLLFLGCGDQRGTAERSTPAAARPLMAAEPSSHVKETVKLDQLPFPYGDPGPERPLLVTPSASDVALRCKVTAHQDELEISYVLTNRTGEDIYVFNRARAIRGSLEFGSRLFGEVCHDETTGVVNVIVGLSPPPSWAANVSPEPGPSRVRHGRTVADSLRLPTPLKEWNAYYVTARSYIHGRHQVNEVRFIVDFVRRSAATFVPNETDDEPTWVFGLAESAWCLLSLPAPVELHRRVGTDVDTGLDQGWTRKFVPIGFWPQRRGTLATWFDPKLVPSSDK